ncbi:MAG TPA: hypothetical protein VFY73_04070 [Ideonella sp.]|uniref:hypothetical protein n=1 Tax=Ideonella sp. TaxID=1929293 RepID=UPI002E317422|nr:hypothetical protein [Ideonella sp.]HEX5683192.1 hypothetical protein [Ideonella sp.]
MLLLWVFGIGAGVANACAVVIEAVGGEYVGVAKSSQPEPATSVASPDTVGHGSHAGLHDEGTPDQQGAPGQSNCRDFCDKTSVSIPPQQSVFDHAQGHALPPLTTAVIPAVASTSWAALPRPDRDVSGAVPVPITIAFLRLAL